MRLPTPTRLDFIDVCAQRTPTTLETCLRQHCPHVRTARVPASATAQGKLIALARIVAGACAYLMRLRRSPERPLPVAIVTHIVFGAVLALGRLLGRPVRYVLLGVIAGTPRTGPFGALRERLYRHTIRRAELVMCYSRRECDLYARRFGEPRGKFHAVPCSANISAQWRQNRRLDLPRPYIASAGRTNRDYATLAEACREQRLPTVVATDRGIPGPIPANLTVRDDLFWSDYLQFLNDAAFVVVPLLRHDESSGQMVMLEAMLLSKAVVVTRTSTTVDYGTHEETCLFVPPGDAPALRRAMMRLRDDPVFARRLGEAGRAYAERYHSSDALARAILAALQQRLHLGVLEQEEVARDDRRNVQLHAGA